MSYYGGWKPYVPVAKRRSQAKKKMEALQKKGQNIQPVEIEGRKIARTFWGEGWCNHLESFSDFDNRLPRGRTYVRNGSVCHLAIKKGKVEAKVAGSDIYEVRVKIKTLSKQSWNKIKQQCSGQIGSLLELLQGELSDNIMTVVTDRKTGLFPKPTEIEFDCDCPDWADMCKHVAATLYGVGARLDHDPALLFRLRGVSHEELVDVKVTAPAGTGKGKSKRLADENLGDVFGIDLDATAELASAKKTREQKSKSKSNAGKTSTDAPAAAGKKQAAKKTTKKKASKKASKKKPAPNKSTSKVQTTSAKTKTKKPTTKKPTTKKKGSRRTTKKSRESSTSSRPAASNRTRKR